MAAEWDKATSLRELDITATDLATNVIQDILTRFITFQNILKTKSKSVEDEQFLFILFFVVKNPIPCPGYLV